VYGVHDQIAAFGFDDTDHAARQADFFVEDVEYLADRLRAIE
jgi:hypothetical protein